MKGFKDTTRTHHVKGGDGSLKGAAKVSSVMRAYKAGELHSGAPKACNRPANKAKN